MPEVGLRDLLRSATSEIHERLHHHEGMAAIQSGNIDQPMYVALLRRLYGFHKPFEAAAEIAPDRTGWLESDLAVFGVDAEMRSALSLCTAFPENPSAEYILGARYVVEGSALGGQGLARKLNGLKGIGVIAGRRFFDGYGVETGAVWRNYLDQLAAAPADLTKRTAIIAGATATFAIFEQWLKGWHDDHE